MATKKDKQDVVVDKKTTEIAKPLKTFSEFMEQFGTGSFDPDYDASFETIVDSSGRIYARNEPGDVIGGFYRRTAILTVPKYGSADEMEDKPFLEFEVCAPPGVDVESFGIPARRSGEDYLAKQGDIVYVGIRSTIKDAVKLSALDPMPYVLVTVKPKTKTRKGYQLCNYSVKRLYIDGKPYHGDGLPDDPDGALKAAAMLNVSMGSKVYAALQSRCQTDLIAIPAISGDSDEESDA